MPKHHKASAVENLFCHSGNEEVEVYSVGSSAISVS